MKTHKQIKNPILKGFNPDPSIIRVGDDYYIATSTFEWFPGVQIHHSKDLIHWRLVTHPLNTVSQLDMLGVPDSCGVWAPCLSYDNGTFYLVYSNVKSFNGVWKDTPNYLVTTNDITGEWSDPVFLNASGFDGSLFHDDNGQKWYLSMLVDHRKGKFFGGIIMQEYDPESKKLIGPTHYLTEGTKLGLTEGPHLYKKDGYYYMILAEGGTEYGHAATILRSKDITGPYEENPANPIVSSRNNPNLELQKTGHGDFVQTQQGDWYFVFLVGRPLEPLGRCIKGRETAIQKLIWDDGEWPRLHHNSSEAQVFTPVPDLPEYTFPTEPDLDNFDNLKLNINFQSLRVPMTEDWISLQEKPGYLRLKGRETLTSCHRQSLIARRIQSDHILASTQLEFKPESFQQMAGLVCYYNTYHYHYLYVSTTNGEDMYLNVITCDKHTYLEPLTEPVNISSNSVVYLRAEIHNQDLQFYYSLDNKNWQKIAPVLDASILSDDYVRDEKNWYRPAFTGAFVGLCCQDLTGSKLHADFDWFEYKEIE